MKNVLQDQNQLLTAVFSDYPIAVAALDKQMIYQYASAFWYKFHQLDGQNIIGKRYQEFLPEILENDQWMEYYRQAVAGEVVEFDQEAVNKYNGVRQWIHWKLKPWKVFPTQEQIGVMLYTETVSKQREMKSKELEQFVYVASHDLQEPIRTVTSVVELLKSSYHHQLDENARKCLDFLTQASDRMNRLIKGLLDYARLGKDREMTLVNCTQLLEEVQADIQTKIMDTHTQVEIGNLPSLMGYETELRLLFQNLFTNAIRFRKLDEAPVIKVNAELGPGYWKFSFSDNGIGMEEQHCEKIFVMFQRLHVRNKYEGNGIGLAHCRKIIELHEGKIWVKSTPNHGSTFYFTIPRNTL